MRKIHLAALAAFLLVVCGGCGYRVGSLMHPQIKTVAVAPVQNETVEYNLTAQVRNLLCERFMVDGSLKLVDEKEADCIVYARVTDVRFSRGVVGEKRQGPGRYFPAERVERHPDDRIFGHHSGAVRRWSRRRRSPAPRISRPARTR